MPDGRSQAGKLAGQEVAFTGRLASMSRAKARELVHMHGGSFAAEVSTATTLLVVGQDGWPLRKDGKLTCNLERARLLAKAGHAISIISEEGFLHQLGLDEAAAGVHRHLTLPELCTLVGVSGEQVRAWLRMGFLQPVQTEQHVASFDFRQVAGLKNAVELLRSGVSSDRLKKSFRQLRRLLPGAGERLSQVSRVAENGQLLVRLASGRVADSSGQLYFDFGDEGDGEPNVVQFQAATKESAQGCFERGCELEEAGKLAEAAEAYRQALLVGGPNLDTCFNLANVLHGLGQREQACERFRQVLELEPACVDAWNNLGNVLAELGKSDEALAAYREALRMDPNYGDARYNLADLLDRVGRREEAKAEWRAYLRQDSTSQWARFAKSRLG